MKDWHDEILESYAIRLLTLPYRWGGDDTIKGFDCSGYVIELLRSVGQLPDRGDWSSQGLFNYFEGGKASHLTCVRFGALVFYGASQTKITHIAFGLDAFRVAEYGGGGSKTKTADDAERHNAFGRIREVDHRGDRVAVLRPYYRTLWGQG